MNPIDHRGWMVPRPGTKSRDIYILMCHGLKPSKIIEFVPNTTLASIRVLAWKIRRPKPLRRSQLYSLTSDQTP